MQKRETAATAPESPSPLHKKAVYSVGPPVAAIVPAGQCALGEEWTECPLLSAVSVSHDTRVFTFGLSDSDKPLNLSTCACILACGGKDEEGNPVVRPYTPVSTNAMVGKFELMVKVYAEGKLTQHMDKMAVGDCLKFKHISFNVKLQYPFNGRTKFGLICGGTGITPMVQALHALLGTPGGEQTAAMLVGNRSQRDILAKETLDDWGASHAGRLAVTHVLSQEPEDSSWAGATGHINKALVVEHMPAPSEQTMILVCGPPPMYGALCGPRTEPEVTGILAELGYDKEQVFKF